MQFESESGNGIVKGRIKIFVPNGGWLIFLGLSAGGGVQESAAEETIVKSGTQIESRLKPSNFILPPP